MPAILPDPHGGLRLVKEMPDGTLAFEHRSDHREHAHDDRSVPISCRRAFDRYLKSSETCTGWRFGGHSFDLTRRVLVMGILNVTPDSFYDGGHHADTERAVEAGLAMIAQGADIIDVGGESTRPGAAPVSPEQERSRVLPVIEALASRNVLVSIDTRHAAVAREALASGAGIVNDISGFREPAMVAALARSTAGAVIMHMQGSPATMQANPRYEWVTGEVAAFLGDALDRLADAGVASERAVVDPGIGFGKTSAHNLELIREVGTLLCLGRPVLLGASRKSFIGGILNAPIELRLEGSLAAGCAAVLRGARILRVHDVAQTARALRVLERLL